jgi:DNA-binding PadR family transcriptional regulator
MKTKPSTEYILLGALMDGPKHGYEIRQFMDETLEATWFVGTSQLYLLLKKLEQSDLLKSSLRHQKSRPSKRIFSLTPQGKTAFTRWLNRPIEHVRDFRFEFLAKLFFFSHLSLKGGEKLIHSQIQEFEKFQKSLREKIGTENNRYGRLVVGFKLSTAEARKDWLLKQAKPFINSIKKTKNGNIY